MPIRGVFDKRTKPAQVQRIHTLRRGVVTKYDCHKSFPKCHRVHKGNSISTRKSFRIYTEGQCVLARRGVSSNLERFM